MTKKYTIQGVIENGTCTLCIGAQGKESRGSAVFQVYGEGLYSGAVCPGHLAVLVRQAEGSPASSPPKAEARADRPEQKAEAKPAAPVPAAAGAPAGNGPAK